MEAEGQDIHLDFLKNKNRSLQIHVNALDENLLPLAKNLTTEVLLTKGWTDISEIQQGDLQSGTIVKVRIAAAGYETQIFSLKIEWYQDELFITARMKKKD
jgi:serine/threonine-protein kinase